MRLCDILYNVEGPIESGTGYRISLIRDNVIYRSHFPERAVTPGVCVVQIAGELLEMSTGLKLITEEVINAKFLNIIDPEMTHEICYEFVKIDRQDNMLKTTVVVRDGEKAYSKLSLRYKVIE